MRVFSTSSRHLTWLGTGPRGSALSLALMLALTLALMWGVQGWAETSPTAGLPAEHPPPAAAPQPARKSAAPEAPAPSTAPAQPASAAELPVRMQAAKAIVTDYREMDDNSASVAVRLTALHALATDGPVAVTSIRRVGAVYEAAVQLTRPRPATQMVVVTVNGEYIMQDALDLKRELREVTGDRRFARCLEAKGLRVYLGTRRPELNRQLAELGRFPDKVTVVCAEGDPDTCKAAGVARTPTFVLGKRRFEGFRRRSFIEALTNCK